ncbi:hypothetical protein ABT026_27430 [Streptomyces sp. NPDC002734]|uniref:hypothetical protein n=1 Tax=Streptomyces sp. NPDC002734 TaxID=3154426 RepID=UPI003317E13B
MTDRHGRAEDSGIHALPQYQDVLAGTNWASLRTPWGMGEALPGGLVQILSPDQAVRSAAIGTALGGVTHQNTIYGATVPVALFVAAILQHPAIEADDAHSSPGTSALVRLLAWLGDTAYDADDASVAIDEYAEMCQFRDVRPALFSAVRPLLSHENAYVRDAALVAAVPLSEHPALRQHRAELAIHARRLLASSTEPRHRIRAFDAMKAWRQPSRHLETVADVLARERFARARARFDGVWTHKKSDGHCEEPPF